MLLKNNEYKDALLNHKCIRQSMNRTQSKYHKIAIYKINTTLLSRFDDEIYIKNNRYDGLALEYCS